MTQFLPTVSPSHREASMSLLSLSTRRQTEWKPQSQKTNQTDHMDHSLVNSMKLWVMPCRATQYEWVMVESSDKTWSTGERNGKPLQCSYLENPRNSMKRQEDMTLKSGLPWSASANMLLEKGGEITPEGMKRWNQSEKNTQLWMWLVMEIKSSAVKSNIA